MGKTAYGGAIFRFGEWASAKAHEEIADSNAGTGRHCYPGEGLFWLGTASRFATPLTGIKQVHCGRNKPAVPLNPTLLGQKRNQHERRIPRLSWLVVSQAGRKHPVFGCAG